MRTTIVKRRILNKERIFFLACFAFGLMIGRNSFKWLSAELWQIVRQIIMDGINTSDTGFFQSYVSLFSTNFALELILELCVFSICALPFAGVFLLCYGMGIGTCLTVAAMSVKTTENMMLTMITLIVYCFLTSCCYIYQAEMVIQDSKRMLRTISGSKQRKNGLNSAKNSAVKLFCITVILSVCALIFTFFRVKLPLI
ncbi:MAG: hypothetical protein IKU72_00255 [Oscillospiraceae bacterium]|nr:hypothetical protein [Oscillospiraceae bacterium]